MGSNMAEAHPVGFQWVMEAKSRGTEVVHIDPRFTRTSALADRHVPLRAGSDIAFLGGLINYILSNELDLFYGADFRTRLPLLSLFETIVDATYTGILKPDARAYRTVGDALGLPPEACVFVDDQKRNVDGALAAGMRAVWFDVAQPARSYAEALGHFGIAFS